MIIPFHMFQIGNLVPDVDRKGSLSIAIGGLTAFLTLCIVHILTRRSRDRLRLEKKEDDHMSDTERGPTPQLSPKPRIFRYVFIDCVRGLAISFVTYFHLVWNLRDSGFLPFAPRIPHGPLLFSQICEFWVYFLICFLILSEVLHLNIYLGYAGFTLVTVLCIQWHYWAAQMSGVGMIMFCVGISSAVQNIPNFKYNKIIPRIIKLFSISLIITIVTFAMFPSVYIYFGALHCITLVSVLHLPFLFFPRLSILAAIGVFAYQGFVGDFPLEVPVFQSTLDHMPWFENFGYLLFGIFCFSIGVHRSTYLTRCLWGMGKPGIHLEESVFPFLGRHSFKIFILYQIVLYPIIKILARLYSN
jgi:uncharacterized membrane protein